MLGLPLSHIVSGARGPIHFTPEAGIGEVFGEGRCK